MDLAAIDEEKQESSFIEKAVFIITPILFVIVLLGLLVTFLDVDIRNKALEIGQDIPVVRNVLPAPSTTAVNSDDEMKKDKYSERIVELETQLATLQNELNAAQQKTIEQEQTIATLQEKSETISEEPVTEPAAITDEQYTARIQELASMFANMTPSKAAPIVQSMTLEEMALLFGNMRADERVRIMEEMTPKTAADVTMLLKESETAKDLEIAALQSRVQLIQSENEQESSTNEVRDADLAGTFSAMEPSAAADMLLKMMDVSSSKVLRILKVTGSTARSAILEEMTAINETTAALLVTRLMQD